MTELQDKLALTELLAALSAAVDRGDYQQIVDCYADESITARSRGRVANSPR
jgi:hypothetical protein